MGTCELCGDIVDTTTTIKVAGSNMQACNKCKALGSEVNRDTVASASHSFKKRTREGSVELEVISNYASVINSALAKKGLNIHQLARMLNIKESTLNKYFTGKIKPDITVARRLETFFEITILEHREAQDLSDLMVNNRDENQELSLGEMIRKQMEDKK